MLKANTPKKLLFVFALFLSGLSASAQFGGNPPSVKWNQVNLPAARVIFPIRHGFCGLAGSQHNQADERGNTANNWV